jgi:hypothetical protein
MADPKILLACAAIFLVMLSYLPYLLAIYRGTNKPHLFSWLIWTLVTVVVVAAQLSGNAGPATLVTAMTCFLCALITFLAFRQGEKNITLTDWIMLIGSLSAIPMWIMTSDPLWSVVIVTIINAAAYIPTFRKAWVRPFEEHILMYAINIPRHMLTIAATQVYSFTNLLYPTSVVLACILLFGGIQYRRLTITPYSSPEEPSP